MREAKHFEQKFAAIEAQIEKLIDAFKGVPFGSPARAALERRITRLYGVRDVLGWATDRQGWPCSLSASKTQRVIADAAILVREGR